MTFDFITDISMEDENKYLDDLFSKLTDLVSAEDEVKDNVFKQTYIPRTL